MRARSLKPGFFTNEYLAMLPPLTRILFEGLWCLADREGRLEDRPRRIKQAILGYDNADVDTMLTELADVDPPFIIRYTTSSGGAFIQIVNFLRHQHVHVKEAASVIPAPNGYHPDTQLALDDSDADTELAPGHAPHRPGAKTSGTRNRLTGTRNPEPGATRARTRTRDAAIDDVFVARMHAEYDPRLGDSAVTLAIDKAQNHRAYTTALNKQRYVQNWLRGDAQRLEPTRPPTNGTANSAEMITRNELGQPIYSGASA